MKMRVRVNAFTVMEVDVEKCAESIGRSPDEVYEALVVAELRPTISKLFQQTTSRTWATELRKR